MKKRKPDLLTIMLYVIIVFAVLYVSAALGAAMDLSVDDEGVLDFTMLMTEFETVLTSKVYELIHDKKIKGFLIGRKFRVLKKEVIRFINTVPII